MYGEKYEMAFEYFGDSLGSDRGRLALAGDQYPTGKLHVRTTTLCRLRGDRRRCRHVIALLKQPQAQSWS